MNNSKKINEKSLQKVYSRSDKAITLIALIVTIIVLLILAGVTISMAVNKKGIFNRAKVATGAYKTGEVKERLNLYLADYQAEKVQNNDLKLIDYLQKQNEIDDVSDNEDGTLTVIMGDYITTVKDDGTGIESVYKGVAPKVEYALYSDAEGKNKIDSSTISDSVYIGVKIINASDFSSSPKIVIMDPRGSEIPTTSVSGFNGYYGVSKNGTYTLKVTGTKKQLISIANKKELIPGSTLQKSQAPKINQAGLIYADLDGDTTTAEGLVVATSSLGTIPNSMPTGYEIKDYLGESKTANGKIITKSSATSGKQFYVLSLADYDSSTYNFDNAKRKTIGEWREPSKDEWNAFMTNLKAHGLTTLNYQSSFGLSTRCWSSSQYDSSDAWYVRFYNVDMDYNTVSYTYGLRLCATF